MLIYLPWGPCEKIIGKSVKLSGVCFESLHDPQFDDNHPVNTPVKR